MNIFKTLQVEIEGILNQLISEGVIPSGVSFAAVTAEPPRDASHGDVATNAAMVIAKAAEKKPVELAQAISKKLELVNMVDSVSTAGPGFINIKLKPYIWQDVVLGIIEEGIGYGNSNMGKNEKVNIEYVSANPTGPMHIGHSRGAVYGDALALLLLKAGYNVTKEYYINDAGSQIDVLAKSAYLRYREALGEDIGEIPEGLYPGEYLKVVGESLAQEYEKDLIAKKEDKWLPIVREFAVNTMISLIKNDLAELGITHDVFTSEKAIQDSGKVEKGLKLLEEKGLIYKGILEAPKGKQPDDWEPREQTLFKSTQFGDDIDRAIKKSDGSYTYFAADIAYHLDKYERGFNKMVIVLGADHGGYVKRLKSVVKAISDGNAEIDVKISQLVNFMDGGKPVKMSKRAGTFTTVRDVLDEVGKDVIRFIMLTRKNDAVLDFDLKLVKEQSKDNPVFYVQYACARANSVIRNANEECPEAVEMAKEINRDMLAKLDSQEEIALIRIMAQWPRIVEAAASANEPHRVAFYLQELASHFHALWNKGKDDEVLRFILKNNPEVTAARLILLKSMINVISSGLFIFNIEPVREM
ncbi:MAG: arginine--tRNA ligase [Alphaproteobacteria bacterium CG11_big_fil_rev_8_21_14_0_20_39_49]|nr:MAG: arginine--tRNA ligase [Alphaproteobacteria bacterium CG11_big_fil_rev_8_21_14_0_20_39_49]